MSDKIITYMNFSEIPYEQGMVLNDKYVILGYELKTNLEEYTNKTLPRNFYRELYLYYFTKREDYLDDIINEQSTLSVVIRKNNLNDSSYKSLYPLFGLDMRKIMFITGESNISKEKLNQYVMKLRLNNIYIYTREQLKEVSKQYVKRNELHFNKQLKADLWYFRALCEQNNIKLNGLNKLTENACLSQDIVPRLKFDINLVLEYKEKLAAKEIFKALL